MTISGYGERYLEKEKFLELCKFLEVKLLDWRMEEEWLEYIEKEKLLFPYYRVVLPKNYALYISKRYFIPKEELPIKWQKIRFLTDQIEDSDHSLNIFHVLDKKTIPYKALEVPKKSEFREWGFKVPSKKYEDEICRQKNYYQHWQVYHLYELTMACTQQYLINVFDDKVLDEIRKVGLNSKKMFRYGINYKFRYLEYFSNNHNLFDMLSFYVSSIHKCNSVPLHKLREYWEIDEEFRKRFELDREKRIAKLTICKYGLKKEEIIEFIRFLCSRYFFYENNKMNKLIKMVQKDIEYLCKLLEDGVGIKTWNLIKEIGNVSEHYYERPLEYILRGEIADAKENIFRSLRDLIGTTIKYENSITEEEVNEFLEFCDSHSMGSIFLEINRFYWGSKSYYGIIQNLISLTMAFEGFLRIILEKSQITIISNNLINVIRKFYENAFWLKEFNKYFDSINQNASIEVLSENIVKGKYHNDTSANEIIKTLYIVRALRNEIAHSPFNMSFKNNHPDFYKEKVIELIWFSWKYAKQNYSFAITTS